MSMDIVEPYCIRLLIPHLFSFTYLSLCYCLGAKQAVSTASTEKKESEMELEHIKSELVKKEKLLNENSKTYSHDVAALAKMDKEVANIAVCVLKSKPI